MCLLKCLPLLVLVVQNSVSCLSYATRHTPSARITRGPIYLLKEQYLQIRDTKIMVNVTNIPENATGLRFFKNNHERKTVEKNEQDKHEFKKGSSHHVYYMPNIDVEKENYIYVSLSTSTGQPRLVLMLQDPAEVHTKTSDTIHAADINWIKECSKNMNTCIIELDWANTGMLFNNQPQQTQKLGTVVQYECDKIDEKTNVTWLHRYPDDTIIISLPEVSSIFKMNFIIEDFDNNTYVECSAPKAPNNRNLINVPRENETSVPTPNNLEKVRCNGLYKPKHDCRDGHVFHARFLMKLNNKFQIINDFDVLGEKEDGATIFNLCYYLDLQNTVIKRYVENKYIFIYDEYGPHRKISTSESNEKATKAAQTDSDTSYIYILIGAGFLSMVITFIITTIILKVRDDKKEKARIAKAARRGFGARTHYRDSQGRNKGDNGGQALVPGRGKEGHRTGRTQKTRKQLPLPLCAELDLSSPPQRGRMPVDEEEIYGYITEKNKLPKVELELSSPRQNDSKPEVEENIYGTIRNSKQVLYSELALMSPPQPASKPAAEETPYAQIKKPEKCLYAELELKERGIPKAHAEEPPYAEIRMAT